MSARDVRGSAPGSSVPRSLRFRIATVTQRVTTTVVPIDTRS